MSDPLLALLLVLLVLMPVFALAARSARLGGASVASGLAVLALSGTMVALAALALDAPPAMLALPIGPTSFGLRFLLDPVAAGLLALVLGCGAVVALVAGSDRPPARRGAAAADLPAHVSPLGPVPIALALAGFGLAAVAGDGGSLATGLAIGGLGTWIGGLGRGASGSPAPVGALIAGPDPAAIPDPAPAPDRTSAGGATPSAAAAHAADPDLPAGSARLAATLFAAAALLVALTLDDPARHARYLCAFAAAAALAGLVPTRAGTSPARGAAVTVLLEAIQPTLALGLLARLTLNFAAGAPPVWWALPPLLLGGAMAVLAGWRGVQAPTLTGIVTLASRRQTGLAAVSFGLLLLARAVDLPALAALATGAFLLLLVTQALGATLAILAAATLQAGAGSDRLDRIGGLVHFMPVTTLALGAGFGGLALLPPSGAFAGVYLALQAVLATPRGTGLAPALLSAFVVLALALGIALAAMGAVRALGVACLGRPRAPRTAGAKEVAGPLRAAWIMLAVAVGAVGLFPGLLLRLADPAVLQLAGTELGARVGVLQLAPATRVPGYAPLPLALLLAVFGGILAWLHRRQGGGEGNSGPAWQQGFSPAPPWLPFGDPGTQSTGEGFVPPIGAAALPRLPALRWPFQLPRRAEDVSPRRGDAVSLRTSAGPAPRRGADVSPRAVPLLLLLGMGVALAVLACLGAA
ncbi:MAG: hypothetical protein J0H19_10115 [Rhodospirillales bacterium]|nr:hypothetical protein [Rhodospirillales bacterium]